MSDERNDKLNMPDADEPSYTVDEILSEKKEVNIPWESFTFIQE